MRILYVLNTEKPGGGNKSLFSLIKYLCEQGHIIFALIPGSNEETEKELKSMEVVYKIYSYRPCVLSEGYKGMPLVRNVLAFPQMLNTVKKWKVNIIHTNSSTHDIGFWLSRALHIKHVWHVREALDLHYNSKYLYKKIYEMERKKSEATICVSNFIYEREKKYDTKAAIIYNPYVVGFYLVKEHRILEKKEIHILVAGYITKSKGQLEAIKGIEKAINKYHVPIRLTIVGNYNLKEDIQEIESFIINNNIEEYVSILPYTSNLRELRANSDIVLNCSKYEAYPRVVIEGMLAGCFVISNGTGGSGEILADGKRGFVYQLGNIDELAEKVYFVSRNIDFCKDIALHAQKWAETNLDYGIAGKKVERLYKELL